MVSAVRALFGKPLGSSLRGVAGTVFYAVVRRGGDDDHGMRMTGSQARLRTVQDKGQEEQHKRQNLAELAHSATLTLKLVDRKAGTEQSASYGVSVRSRGGERS